MSPAELAEAYIQAFCEGDLTALAALLAEDLRFSGPHLRCSSREEYMQALRTDPPRPAGWRILSVLSDGTAAAVFWEYHRAGGTLQIAQHITLRNNRIADLRLVFDSARAAEREL